MAVVLPGDAVLALIRSATSRVVIAAPYIKSATIRRLLRTIPDTVSELTCITRWLPEDIVSGVCDLEIFDDVTQIQGGRLLVQPHLHAKYYSNGQENSRRFRQSHVAWPRLAHTSKRGDTCCASRRVSGTGRLGVYATGFSRGGHRATARANSRAGGTNQTNWDSTTFSRSRR